MTSSTPTTPVPANSPVAKYTAAKFWVAFVMAMLVTASTVFTSGEVQRIITIVLAFLTSGFVYLWPNEKQV